MSRLDKAIKFAERMSQQLFEMRIESDAPYGDDNETIPQEYGEKIVDDETHMVLIKGKIFQSILMAIKVNLHLYWNEEEQDYRYETDTYDHAFVVDAYVQDQYDKEHPELKTVIVCDECLGINVQSKGWVYPNKNNEFVDLMSEEVQDNYCDDCECNVSTSSLEVNVRDPKYQIK